MFRRALLALGMAGASLAATVTADIQFDFTSLGQPLGIKVPPVFCGTAGVATSELISVSLGATGNGYTADVHTGPSGTGVQGVTGITGSPGAGVVLRDQFRFQTLAMTFGRPGTLTSLILYAYGGLGGNPYFIIRDHSNNAQVFGATLIQNQANLFELDLTTYFDLFSGTTFRLLTSGSGAFSLVGATYTAEIETSAVPLPAAGWLLLAALCGTAVLRRRA
ncbi:VPLPA-CTERM sorting domain-containing protein [Mangrovicoccus ximenensis]|uniref:VPLPA-CTERM sorting domain-containing protein n=1 Tax=Mangrovicoccus ximenensis TaxID=1911570 RepID=UPI000D334435|nr:VPLPA-CTERM sorting domain-containing protein [Mangrovicoccus ximenensis]